MTEMEQAFGGYQGVRGVRGYLTGSRKVLNSIPRVSVRLGGSGVNRTQNHPVAPALAENDDRWSLVLRVAASRQFTKAPQLHDMLLYICQRALTHPGASIKEHEIGCNALGRKADFNPNEDNITGLLADPALIRAEIDRR